MRLKLITAILGLALLTSCNKDKDIVNSLNDYNLLMETKGYRFGDKIEIPVDVLENSEKVSISFGDKDSDNLVVDPNFFRLGENHVTFRVDKKGGGELTIDAVIFVLAKNQEKNIAFDVVGEYPHNKDNFTQGFEIEGNTIYESNGGQGTSSLVKYELGSTTSAQKTNLGENYFAEGSAIVGDKIYQLTWHNRKGFVYNKSTLTSLTEFPYPDSITEGWGLTYDGKNLIMSDGSSSIYFINPDHTNKLVKQIGVAGYKEEYTQLNELEYHNGFLYANVWQNPIILKINPANGEVVGVINLASIAQKHTKGVDDVLNGITFRGENMLITGKNWDKIYEIRLK